MANDLSTPLTGRKRRGDGGRGRLHLPLGRILFGIIAVIVLGLVLRVVMVEDPNGGRPSQEVAITSTRDGNAIANAVATGPVTITADPGQFPAGAAITEMTAGHDAPADMGPLPVRDTTGALPDLSEETANGAIPRISGTGTRPFEAYRNAAPVVSGPKVAIIVTGLGINEQGSLDAIGQLPPDVTLAFAPYGRQLQNTVSAARSSGHEVMLEIPLEPFDYPQNDPGPHTILTGEAPRANLEKLFWLMARFGGYFGVINNMGARFTASGTDFSPIMEELGARGIGYIDDGSSNRSVAQQLSSTNKVPFAKASLIIDANPSRQAILAALASLENQAMESGGAIGIVSALPISVQAVTEWSQDLQARGITLVPASALMK